MKKTRILVLMAAMLAAFVLPATAQFGYVGGADPTAVSSNGPQLGVNTSTGTVFLCAAAVNCQPVTAAAQTTSAAAPATQRVVIGQLTANYQGSISVSGSIVGVRGNVTLASGSTLAAGYVYGTQGKYTNAGTVNGNAWIAGIMGQLDVSSGTLTAASHLTPAWFDMGATGPTGTKAFMDGIVVTNTIAGLQINSLLYGYARASYVFDLTGANGTPFALDTSGTSAGQCAQTGGVVFAKAMPVKIDGTNYWIPLCSAL